VTQPQPNPLKKKRGGGLLLTTINVAKRKDGEIKRIREGIEWAFSEKRGRLE